MATEKVTNLLNEIKELTILEMADLVKALEEEFGVTAAPVAVAGGALTGSRRLSAAKAGAAHTAVKSSSRTITGRLLRVGVFQTGFVFGFNFISLFDAAADPTVAQFVQFVRRQPPVDIGTAQAVHQFA